MRRRGLALALLALGTSGVAHGSVSTAADTQRLELEVGGKRMLAAQLSAEGLRSEGVHLQRCAQGLWGTLGLRPVELRWEAARLHGRLGGDAVQLRVQQRPPGIGLEGRLGEAPVDLTLTPLSIQGTLGACRYTLPFSGGAYAGWRDCGGSEVPVRTRLRLPEGLSERRDVERAALLLVLLSRLPPPASP